MMVFIMHFWELRFKKNAVFINKQWHKKPPFLCVFCDFSRFLENRKKFTSTNVLAHFAGVPCKLQADHGQIKTTSRGASILSNTSLKVCNACKSLQMFLFKIEKNKNSKINPKINLKIPKKKDPQKIGSDLLTSNRSTYRHPWFRPRRDLKTLQKNLTIFHAFANIFAHSSKTPTPPKILEESAGEDFGDVAVSWWFRGRFRDGFVAVS